MHILLIIILVMLGIYGWVSLVSRSLLSGRLLILFLSAIAFLGVADQSRLEWSWVQFLLSIKPSTYFTYLLGIVGLVTFNSTYKVASGRGEFRLLLSPIIVFAMGCFLFICSWVVFCIPTMYATAPNVFYGLLFAVILALVGYRLGKGKPYNDSSFEYDEVSYEEPKKEIKDPKALKYYQQLGLDYGASKEQIKTSYRTLIRKYHPDLHHNDSEAERITVQLNEAYNYLKG